MARNAQISVFVIIGVILILFLLIQFYSKPNEKQAMNNPLDTEPIKSYVESCIKNTGYDALVALGWTGGTIVPREDSIVTDYAIINLLYDGNENKVPDLNEIEYELSLYMDEYVGTCLSDPDIFPDYSFTYGTPKVNTSIAKDEIAFLVNYPVTISTNRTTATLTEFSSTVNFHLVDIIDLVNIIIEKHREDPDWIDATFLSNLGVNVTIYPYNSTILVYEILDDTSLLNDEPYRFLFAVRLPE